MKRRDLDAELTIVRLPKIRRRERAFEYALRDELKRRGIMFIKTKPTIKGFPDRLAMARPNRMRLVECKRGEGDELSDTQKIVHADLRRMGIEVLIVRGPDVVAAANLIASNL